MAGSPEAISVFISYAHEDEKLLQELETHLSLMRRQELISDWHDHQILAGDEWARDIDQHLKTASIILLLISPNFLASEYCYNIEMRQALERHKCSEARVIPVILRPCDWQTSPFAHLQCLPRNTKPITTWDNQDEAFVTIAQELRLLIAQQHFPDPPLSGKERQNRARLLKRVRAIWIKGLLENSLHHAAWIDLHLREQPDALENPWRLQVQELNQSHRALPVGTSVVKVFDEADGELLLLGEPGSGKTTLLLHLARTLLDRAEADERYQMPVIFNLSSWAQKQESLATWLVEELKTKYQVPRQVGQRWIGTNQVLPLLDGLDEVTKEARVACIQAITAYYHYLNRTGTSLVICCRNEEYQSLSLHLPLQRAVSILPLTDEQIEEYLSNLEGQLEGLSQALHDDADLYELAHRPLMLSIFTLAYQGEAVTDFPTHEQVLQAVFANYVKHMLSRRGLLPSWMQERFLPWITYLAKQLYQRQQTVFSVEDLEPDWLPGKQQYLYSWSLWLLVGLGLGLLSTLLVGLGLGQFGRPETVVSSVMGSGPDNNKQSEKQEVTHRSKVAIYIGMLSMLAVMFVGILGGSLGAVLFASLIGGLIAVRLFIISRIQLTKEVSLFPNEGIWRSMINGLVGGLFGMLSFGLFGVLSFGLGGGLFFGLFGGLCIGLGRGLFICIKHFILRFWLWRTNCLPWKLVPFLDEAAERLFLRKVGGSYIFVHRLLLDYFASLDSPSVSYDISANTNEKTTEE